MKTILAAATLALATSTGAATAGCLSGAAVGGVVGHVAGHHGLLGAGAGCVIGHHRARVREERRREAEWHYRHEYHHAY